MLKRILAAPALILLAMLSPVRAQDAPAESKPRPNRFAVPEDASAAELIQFLERLRITPPARDERKARIRAVFECTSLILESDAVDEDLAKAAEARLFVLPFMPQVDRNFDGQTQEQFLKKLQSHSNPKLAVVGKHFVLQQEAKNLMKLKRPLRTALIDESFAAAEKYGVDARLFTLLRTNIAMQLENAGDYKQAGEIYKRLAPMMAASEDNRLKNYGPKLVAAAERCLNLPGKPIQLEGALANGDAFDWEAYEGKVVLVDFWATWCKPCVRDFPQLKKLYDQYHDRGFEIVGINLDSKRDRLAEFLEARDVPWAQIVGDEANSGWQHPIVVRYGINSVPTQMLIDREGKVISLNIRGRELESQLRVMFPEAKSRPNAR